MKTNKRALKKAGITAVFLIGLLLSTLVLLDANKIKASAKICEFNRY